MPCKYLILITITNIKKHEALQKNNTFLHALKMNCASGPFLIGSPLNQIGNVIK